MRLVELEFQLRSFAKRQTITFREDGMIMITGRRIGEDTASGAGKSSIPIAIAFALGFCDLPMTDLTNWQTDEKPYVRLRLADKAGNVYDIERQPKLQVYVNGVPVTGTATASDEKLKEIISTAPELTKTLTYSPQRSDEKFITKTDSEQKEFLTTVLNLGQLEAAEEKLSARLKDVQLKHQSATGTIKQIEVLEPTVRFITQEELQASYDEVMRLDAIRKSVGNTDSSQQLRQEIALFDAEIGKIHAITQASANATYQNTQIKHTVESLKAQIEQIRGQIAHLQKNTCPTCLQEWGSAEVQVRQYQDKITAHQTTIAHHGQTWKANMATIQAGEPYKDPSIIASIQSQKTAKQQELVALGAPAQEAERNFAMANQNYAGLTAQANQQRTLAERKAKAIEEERQYAIQEHILHHASQMAGRQGFLGEIFQEVLSEIEVKANEFISGATNVNTFTLQFSTDSVTQKGKVNKKITTTIWKSGKAVKLKALSGGQQASIELAVELAVISVVKARSGIDLGWLILDESMDGMDVALKYEWIELIKTRIDTLLIVIDHASEIKELFDSVIEVQFDGQDSEIVGF